jgi:hypothetical protein
MYICESWYVLCVLVDCQRADSQIRRWFHCTQILIDAKIQIGKRGKIRDLTGKT